MQCIGQLIDGDERNDGVTYYRLKRWEVITVQ